MRSEAFDGFAVDMWAAGIVLFELLVGKKPFAMPDPAGDRNFRTISVDGDLEWLLRAKGIGLDGEAVHLLQGMLRCDPAERLTLSQVVNHPWVRGQGKRNSPASVQEVGFDGGWFINNRSVDDMDSTKCAHTLLTGLVDSCSTNDDDAATLVSSSHSTITTMNDCDASTSVLSDAESQNPLSEASSSDHSSRQDPTMEPQGDEEPEVANESNLQKKATWLGPWLGLRLKNRKDQRTGASPLAPLQTIGERP